MISDDCSVSEYDLSNHYPGAGVYYNNSNLIIYDYHGHCLKHFRCANNEVTGGEKLMDISNLMLFVRLENKRGCIVLKNGVIMLIPLYLLEELGSVSEDVCGMLGDFNSKASENYTITEANDHFYYVHKDCNYLEFYKLKLSEIIYTDYRQNMILLGTRSVTYTLDIANKKISKQ